MSLRRYLRRGTAIERLAPLPTVVLMATLVLAVASGSLPSSSRAQSHERPGRLLDAHAGAWWVPQTPGIAPGAPAGLLNPAAWAVPVGGEAAFWWNDRSLRDNALDNWGFAVARRLGFAVNSQVFPTPDGDERMTDYQLGISGGDRAGYWGLAYRWAGGGGAREPSLALGFLDRPVRQISVGVAGQTALRSSARQLAMDLGLRPLGSDAITVYGGYVLDEKDRLSDGRWSAGLLVRPVRGLHLGAKVLDAGGFADRDPGDDVGFVLDVGVTLNDLGLHAMPALAEGGDHASTGYLARFDPPWRGLAAAEDLLPLGTSRPRFVAVNLEHKRLGYRKYRWFDEQRVAWIDLARYLDAAAADPAVEGVAVNLVDLETSRVLAWELRRKLAELRAAGKEVVVAVGNLDMTTYALASVADRIVLDPEAVIMLPGVALTRTYMADMMAGLGLGVQELRYFAYKSAVEVYARTGPTQADREQRLRVAEVLYDVMRDLAAERPAVTTADYDAAVDDVVMVLAQDAVERGLVDEIGRWSDLQQWVSRQRGGTFVAVGRNQRPNRFPEEQWGPTPRVAVVYALGPTLTDQGIRGRATSAYLRGLKRDPQVKAVVLRVDSPGGDGLASELVAGAVRELKEAGKPVVVSQGNVAASGGYWLSMDASRILTTPVTLTGSIGVIALWVYDDGFGDKLGLNAESVQVGEHADLFATLRLPVLGTGPPVRALDQDELQLVRDRIVSMYDRFVGRVATGRSLSEDQVREIAQGRVWMGGDAIELGLCDAFGTLTDAIAVARELADIPAGRQVELVEFPPRPLFELPRLGPELPSLYGLAAPALALLGLADGSAHALPGEGDDADLRSAYLKLAASSRGRPLVLLPAEYLELP
ncbi:MAG: S49 family peptidase [Candidatus Krumholzibacteriia bacterium]